MLAETVLAHAPQPLRSRLERVPNLESQLAGVVAAARSAWPDIDIDDAEFVRYVAERLPPEWEPARAFDALHSADLYLACACAGADGPALAVFEADYMPEVRRAASRLQLGDKTDDLAASVREHLFVARGSDLPKIASYSGIGNLRAWLRVTATRMGLRAIRRESRQAIPDASVIADAPSPGTLPDLKYIKQLYRSEFAAAFREASEELTPRQRTLLRQRYLDGLTGDDLAAQHRVHRATVVRWLAGARQALLSGTRKILVKRLRVQAAEADSILRFIRSQLDVSIPFFLHGDESDL